MQWRSYASVTDETSSAKPSKAQLDSSKIAAAAKAAPSQNPSARAIPTVTENPSPNATESSSSASQEIAEAAAKPPRPLPANVIAAYKAPLKHETPYGVPVAQLQLRSYSVRSLEFFADFALRAAYYLNLPASGPVPLPKRIERWTMPRANFIHKKSQENFERITYKRSITISDGHQSAVEVWLAVLRKWQFHGVGMKANVWAWEGVDVADKLDAQAKNMEKEIEAKLADFGWNQSVAKSRSLDDMLHKQGVKHAGVGMTEVREGARRRKSEI